MKRNTLLDLLTELDERDAVEEGMRSGLALFTLCFGKDVERVRDILCGEVNLREELNGFEIVNLLDEITPGWDA